MIIRVLFQENNASGFAGAVKISHNVKSSFFIKCEYPAFINERIEVFMFSPGLWPDAFFEQHVCSTNCTIYRAKILLNPLLV